ncbi:TetR/AcrR family transcriptional regulator [Streptomyces sp. NPDC090052]|uniref:TetR/AcrR family transcriptional regulator n=1 Tax=unclassified Streptomyces TaxID=2593676 RepID=UPI00225624CC|nr:MULTISPECIES: TetR/AcrR family transcriptional regulator [unclassified Streptomyces]MCX4728694.1 TetR/AcrR family transcriptional regulator [Streptomyces sp. NBC_01306]MCX4729149.1 TetR/AcrR family transcriptional regulator [Streptomyces sp. NBC_01306]WSX46573.1 TetR/AcrR family transcriptional regulator [Streptomyces sp. NBC_00963]WSX65347.1 TetR/AcrR family transcriptional regulator [Streptomyces sp. NBC_00932]
MDAQRERILQAAAEVLAERGFDAGRLRDVATTAGLSIGSLQHYFETRDALFLEAFAWSIDDLIERWRRVAVEAGSAWRRFELLVQALTSDPDLTRRCATWTEFCASASRREELRDGVRRVHAEWQTLMSEIVHTGLRSEEFTPVLPVDLAIGSLVVMVDGCELAVASGGGLTAERYAELLLGTARAVLGVRA